LYGVSDAIQRSAVIIRYALSFAMIAVTPQMASGELQSLLRVSD